MANNPGIVVKAYLDTQEIRRFLLDTTVCTDFEYVSQKIRHIFQLSPHQQLRFSWKDEDGDPISFSSNEELVEALNQVKDNIFRVYVSRSPTVDSSIIHIGVVCDGCQQPLRGTRYKCTVCPDYDLCSRCEFDGKHNQHDMMCVRRPIPPGDWVFWHNFANVNSHQRGTDYQLGNGPQHGWPWRCRNKLWKKAWKCHQRLQRDNSREPVFAPTPPESVPKDGKSDSCSKEGGAPRALENQREFLRTMSEAVQSMLNPFGIDVSFSLPDEEKVNDEKTTEEGASKENEKEKDKEKIAHVQQPEKQEAKKETPAKPQAMNVDLDSSPGTPDPQRTAEFIVIDPDDEEAAPRPAPAPKVAVSLELMKRMGFNDEGGWLTAMLSENDGDIGRVLDVIQRRCNQD